MIGVNSYPELFTTLLGWQQYQNIWNILVNTGLAYIPFITMIIKNTAEPFQSQEARSAYPTSLKRVEIGLGIMLVTIMFACQPMITIDPSVIHYQPVCNPGVIATPGNSGTTYDEAFGNMQPVKVPLWWDLVMSVSHGVTSASIVGLGCRPNLREDIVQLHLSQIHSMVLRSEVKSFQSACYIPAKRKYLEDKPDISAYTKLYGSADTEWLGSHAFINMPGYYDSFRSPNPIPGFPYIQSKDWSQGSNHGQWGAPNCKNWWTAPKVGLYAQLKAQISPSLWQKITSMFSGQNASDSAIKELISNSVGSGYQDGTQALESDTSGFNGGYGTGIIAGLGADWESLSYFPKMYLVIETLPLIQAFLLMACYIFLAIAIPVSGYSLRSITSLSFCIFSIIFWSYLWKLATWADSAMIRALDPMGGFHAVGKTLGGMPVLTDMVAVTLYILIPLFWTIFMGWAGIKAGAGVNSMVDRSSGVGGSGSNGQLVVSTLLKR